MDEQILKLKQSKPNIDNSLESLRDSVSDYLNNIDKLIKFKNEKPNAVSIIHIQTQRQRDLVVLSSKIDNIQELIDLEIIEDLNENDNFNFNITDNVSDNISDNINYNISDDNNNHVEDENESYDSENDFEQYDEENYPETEHERKKKLDNLLNYNLIGVNQDESLNSDDDSIENVIVDNIIVQNSSLYKRLDTISNELKSDSSDDTDSDT
jgi:hypothetical protein